MEFLRALEAGDDRRAVKVYGGELLPSFILPDLHEFDRWLQSERQRLRAAAIQAAVRLIDSDEQAGAIDEAARVARWALRLEPTNEAVARRLIALLARGGHRGAALEVFDSLRQRLSEDLYLEPAQETTALVSAVQRAGVVADQQDPLAYRRGGSGSRQRVLVLPLEDLTGDASLSALGRLAADALAQHLAAVADLEVVPPIAALGAVTASGAPPEPGSAQTAEGDLPPDSLLELARRAGAGTLVTGTYYLDAAHVAFRVRITDVLDAKLLEGPAPVLAPRATPARAVEELAERVAAFLAPAVDRRAVHVRKAVRPPGLAAYQAYLDGLEMFIRGEWQAAVVHFQRSAEKQPTYALPRIVWAIALWNLGELKDARTTAEEAAGMRDTVGRFEQGVLDMVRAWLSGDWTAAYRAARLQADLAPGSIPHFQVAEEARRLNRPRECREILSFLNPEAGELEGWIFYWVEITAAHHMLGDHGREFELASRCRRLHTADPRALLMEIRALAALGRVPEVRRLIEEALTAPGARPPRAGALLREAAFELRSHGWVTEAGPLLAQAVEWYEQHVGPESSDADRRKLARALYDAGRLDEARVLFNELARRPGRRLRPVGHHHAHLQGHIDEGYLAVIAATLGHQQETVRWCSWLEELDEPFLYGAQWFWRAAVAAMLDERDRAVNMLHRALADGLPNELFLHTDPHLMRLRGHPSFDAVLRPRG